MRSKRKRLAGKAIDAINVVPMTDILLTLLIFFLFIETAQLSGAFSFTGEGGDGKPGTDRTVTVKCTAEGELSVIGPTGTAIGATRESLVPVLKEMKKHFAESRVVIDADKKLPYKDVVRLMDDVKSAGFEGISLVDSRSDSGK